MSWHTYYNPTGQPVQVDDDGRTIFGRQFGAADGDDRRVDAATATGRLVAAPTPPEGSPRRESWERAEATASRARRAGELTKSEVAKAATAAGHAGAHDLPKDELVRLVAHSGAELPPRENTEQEE